MLVTRTSSVLLAIDHDITDSNVSWRDGLDFMLGAVLPSPTAPRQQNSPDHPAGH